jgi:low temperature requirement protein LtrA
MLKVTNQDEYARGRARQEAEPLELFFDLVYVFAISQLSHALYSDPTWLGAAQALILYAPVFNAWAYTTWTVTMVGPDDSRTRRLLLLVMVGGLFMNAAIPRAFEDAGAIFAVIYVAIQLGRAIWLVRVDLQPTDHVNQSQALVWFAATAPLWLIGAAVTDGGRLAWWAAAAFIDVVGTWSAHPIPGMRLDTRQVSFSGHHLLERGRLFTIIALGETVLTTGMTLDDAPIEPMTVLTATVALSGTIALFWLYFGGAESIVQSNIGRAEDPILIGRRSIYALSGAVAGLVVAAVGDERVIAQPLQQAGAATNLMLYGGPALYIATQAWYSATVLRDRRIARPIALIALVAGALITVRAPAYLAATVAAAIVVGLAAYLNGLGRRAEPLNASQA